MVGFMLVEIGHFALVLALLVAAVQGTLPLAGAGRRSPALMDVARPAALMQFGLVALAFAVFMHAHIVSDFSVRNVFENSNTAKPMLYKVTGVWGSHEGSMLLWVFMLSLFGGLVALLGRGLPAGLRARALAIQGLLGFGTLAFILFTSDPFARLFPVPADGRDLNPLLQDPGLAFHPPFLYFGYVGFSITYSFAIAGLIEGRLGAAWARWVRPWTLTAWCGLTIGIAMGSWWAYYVLGWGGWWYWDPVENASFMPWLLGTALLHSAAMVEKRETMQRWTVLLAILTFGMSLIGTFLVRSGVLTSVHSFAVDPARGVFILVLVALVIGGGLILYALRAPRLEAGSRFAPVSREGALVLNNLLICAGMATVFLGTFYPLFAEIWSGVKLSVGPQFFDATFVPIMAPAIVAMAVGPVLAWRRGNLWAALRRLAPAFAGAVIVPAVVFFFDRAASPAALFGVALAVWAMLGVLSDLADRGGVGRLPPAVVLRRLRHLPRGNWGYAHRPFRGRRADRRRRRLDRLAQRADRDPASRRYDDDRRPHPAPRRRHPSRHRQLPRRARRDRRRAPRGRALHPPPRAALVSGRRQPHHQHRDLDQRPCRPLSGAGRSGRERRLGGARLLQPARPVDLARRDPRRTRRAGFVERPAAAAAPAGGPRRGGGDAAAGRPAMIRLLLAAALLVAIAGPAGAVEPSERLADPALEARARTLSRELRCLVCQNQSIDESNADLAHDLRVLIRRRLAAGDSDRQVLDYLVARYGVFVLLDPPFEPATWLLWLGPPLLLAGAGAVVALRARRRRPGPGAPGLTPEERSRAALLLGGRG